MSKLLKLQLACMALAVMFCAATASAFNPSSFAANSRLATGKWVKIYIPESGMYEITYEELVQMGFTDPTKVKIYGAGGNRISEVLNTTSWDDVARVPILRMSDKICFYGNGPTAFTISHYSTTPHFTRTFNPYATEGCYFLTQENGSDLAPSNKKLTLADYTDVSSCLSMFYHEKDETTISSTGKDMFGEDFSAGNMMVDYYLPEICDSSLVVHTSVAVNASDVCYANAALHSGEGVDTTVYTLSSSRIYNPSNDFIYYNFASPYGVMKLTDPAEHGKFEPILIFNTDAPTINIARLDYFMLTYTRNNVIKPNEDGNQMLMGYANTTGTERFLLPGATSTTRVWNISNTRFPVNMETTPYANEDGSGYSFFATASHTAMYVAFDPVKTLKKITRFEPVENQNLHALPTPDLLIITDKIFHEQAERLADVHRVVDGIDVLVVDQDKIFNEFSSGRRDAMAYRLFCKMFYDRDSQKFKNLLLFGPGTYDNRGIMGEHPGTLLTYQSDNSNYEDFSFTSDDFFGFLSDNSGTNVSADVLSIGVGRITCEDVEEAESDVDKFVEYYAQPDYGVWRNNTMVVSDAPDEGLYMFQGEGYKSLIDNNLNTGMHVTTVHTSQYPRSTTEPNIQFARKTTVMGKRLMSNTFKDGAYFATYVGHAGPISFTKVNKMWTTSDVARTSYNHFPIMSTACCDVAHYDSDTRGIAESMFHKRDGGAIALLTSSRMVFASDNDKLNTYFLNNLFCYDTKGYMPTLGEAYMYAKRGFISTNTNKMSFFLLGDPAIKVNYPISRFNITSINNVDMTDSTATANVSPLMQFELKAQVVDADGNLDTSFNGDATATLYDCESLFTTINFSISGVSYTRDIYTNREKLTEVSGRVNNGIFTASMIGPRSPEAKNKSVMVRVYAHKDNSDYMVNGFTRNVNMLPYDENLAVTDSQDPVINTMFINDEGAFSNGALVGTNSMLYITASDDMGINIQPNSMDYSMSLVLDGGKNAYSDITSFATVADGNKVVNIEVPIKNLGEGLHTLTYTVYDMVGNSASRTITFMVGQNTGITLTADALPAFLNRNVHFELASEMTRMPEVTLRVTDATGKLVWKTTTTDPSVTWDFTGIDGKKVPAGLYRYFGTYNDGTNYGGTEIKRLIVLDALKTAN